MVDSLGLPFVTRQMLDFADGAAFSLRITIIADSADPVVIRGFSKTSTIHQVITPTSDGIKTVVRIGVDDIPIMIGIFDTDDLYRSGECWGSIALEIKEETIAELCSGFIAREKSISWPATNSQALIPNRGAIVTVASPNPAAGAEASITVPAGEMWHILFGSVQLVTDANAANRLVHILFTTSDGVVANVWPNHLQVASQDRTYSFAKFSFALAVGTSTGIKAPLPHDIFLDQLSTIVTATENIQVGDDFGVMRFVVEKFFDRNV